MVCEGEEGTFNVHEFFFYNPVQKSRKMIKRLAKTSEMFSIRKRKPSQSDDTDRENTSSHRPTFTEASRHDIRAVL